MTECIFCKIVKGEIPSHTIYEDELVKAFLDITPANTGHTLIIPKIHRENIFEITKEELCQVSSLAKSISERIKEKLGVSDINIIQSNGKNANQDVMHFHMHVVPRKLDDGLNIWQGKKQSKEDLSKIQSILKF